MQLARFFVALAVLTFAMLAMADNGVHNAEALVKRQSSASTSANTVTTTTQGIAYSPGPQVGPTSYVAPTGATGEPVSPTNTGPVGGAINSAHRQRSPLDSKVVGSLSLVGVVVGGAWMAVGL